MTAGRSLRVHPYMYEHNQGSNCSFCDLQNLCQDYTCQVTRTPSCQSSRLLPFIWPFLQYLMRPITLYSRNLSSRIPLYLDFFSHLSSALSCVAHLMLPALYLSLFPGSFLSFLLTLHSVPGWPHLSSWLKQNCNTLMTPNFISIITVTNIYCSLLGARHCPKRFAYSSSFKPHFTGEIDA